MPILFGTRRALRYAPTTEQGPVYDEDAQAYFTAASIADADEKEAANTLIEDLKSSGLWNKMERCFLFSPTSASAALYCAKSLQTMTNVNSVAFSTNGFTTDGASDYLDTNYSPSSTFTTSSAHVSVYTRSDISGDGSFIVGTSSGGDQDIYAGAGDGTGQGTFRFWSVDTASSFNLPTRGLLTFTRQDSMTASFWDGGSTVGIDSIEEVAPPPVGTIVLGYSFGGYYSHVYNFLSIGSALSDSNVDDLNTLVEAYQTALGRAVA